MSYVLESFILLDIYGIFHWHKSTEKTQDLNVPLQQSFWHLTIINTSHVKCKTNVVFRHDIYWISFWDVSGKTPLGTSNTIISQ